MPSGADAHDLLNVYVQFASSGAPIFDAHELRQRFGEAIDQLLTIGAIEAGRCKTRVICRACYEAHSTEIIFDAETRRSWMFCAEAGRVWLNDEELATIQVVPSWLPDQLSASLAVASRPPRLTLIERAAWLLGDMVVGTTRVSVALAIGIKTIGQADELAKGLARRTPIDIGLLCIADCRLPERFGATTGYGLVGLDEIASVRETSIDIERDRLHAWIRSFLREEAGPKSAGAGRPSLAAQVLSVFEARRRRGVPQASQLAEARGIRGDWTSLFPDADPPALSTIRKHLTAP